MKIKGFDKNLCCMGMQYEIGKEYKKDVERKNMRLCTDTVFHYCDSLAQVHNFYSCANENNRFCEIEVLGDEITDNEKCRSKHIKIVREIKSEELEKLKGKINRNTGLFNTGVWNAGSWNAGDFNTGDWNAGSCNTGDYNAGSWNSCNHSNGFFNTIEDDNIKIFNKGSGMSYQEFYNSKYYKALTSVPFILTEWIQYTEKEKDGEKRKVGGYLKEYTYKEACKNWWEKLTEENKNIIKEIPNFDKAIFKEITGIDV